MGTTARAANGPRKRGAARDPLEPSEIDPSTRFLYTPHTVTFLLLGLLAVAYFSHALDPEPVPADPQRAAAASYASLKTGIWAIVLVYLGYSVVQGPDTPLVRPHPAFWRLVHGIMVCYLLFMTFLLFQDVSGARQLLKHLYPELGVELPERSYGDDCALYTRGRGINWQVIHATVFDEFVVAHALGWWGKALILRDNLMLWTISIMFELMEQTFKHWLPNFNECWWDSWVLDVLLCNWAGIVTGMWTVRYFKGKQYNWAGISRQPSLLAKAKRGVLQFTPHSWDDFAWGAFSSPKRLLQCLIPVAAFLLFEVNHFFLKFELWVPPTNPLNTLRLTIVFLMALPATKEYFEFIDSSPRGVALHKLGAFAWLGLAIGFVETLVVVKFGKGLFPQPWPRAVLLAWSVAGAVASSAFALWCYRFYVLGQRGGRRGAHGAGGARRKRA